jgi:hypothetical protein
MLADIIRRAILDRLDEDAYQAVLDGERIRERLARRLRRL